MLFHSMFYKKLYEDELPKFLEVHLAELASQANLRKIYEELVSLYMLHFT